MSKPEDSVPLLAGNALAPKSAPLVSTPSSTPEHVAVPVDLQRLINDDPGDSSNYSGSSSSDGDGPARFADEVAEMEVAVHDAHQAAPADATLDGFSWARCATRVVNCLFFMYWLVSTTAIATVLGFQWSASCDQPLHWWAIGQILITTGGLIARVAQAILAPADENERSCGRVVIPRFIVSMVNTAWFVWFVVEMIWTFKTDTCRVTAPALYMLSVVLVSINLSLVGLALVACCCIFSCLGVLYTFYPNLFRRQNEPEGASQTLIDALETKKFTADMLPSDDRICAICLDQYNVDDEIRILRCKPKRHHFHRACVDQWLALNKTCPLCKVAIDATQEVPEEIKETSS